MTPLDPKSEAPSRPLPGLEPDNLLSFLVLLGLLDAVETARPDWRPRISWAGPPWTAQLHLAQIAEDMEIAQAADEGVSRIVTRFDFDKRKNVDFTPEEYRRYAITARAGTVSAALAAAMTAEWPRKKDGGLAVAPLVMMFGQGHQNFLERLIDVPSGKLPNRLRKLKFPPNMCEPAKIAEALFQPWRRDDDADGFRWDPEDDQRYALRYGDPSRAGAALTVIGANRLAAIGFLSFARVPAEHQIKAVGAIRENGEWVFVWPIWLPPLSRAGIRALLNHPALLQADRHELRLLGVAEIFRARRIANGKFMNVTRATPMVTQGIQPASSITRSS